jgi:hypothetical protein
MKMTDFFQLVASGATPIIEFAQGVDEKESFAEKGMRARVLGASDDSPSKVIRLLLDFSEFEGMNFPLQSANYFDKKGNPCLTAQQAGFYRPQDDMHVDHDESMETLFKVADDSQTALFDEYCVAAAQTPMTYLTWLEQALLKARSS